MKIRHLNDLRRPAHDSSIAVNERHNPSFEGVTSQFMSQRASCASLRFRAVRPILGRFSDLNVARGPNVVLRFPTKSSTRFALDFLT